MKLFRSIIRLFNFILKTHQQRSNGILLKRKIWISRYDTRFSTEWPSMLARVSVDNIRVPLIGVGKVKITDTPHFSYVKSVLNNQPNPTEYIRYIQEAHSLDSPSAAIRQFEETITCVLDDLDSVVLLVNYPEPDSPFVELIDGTHRLAVIAGLKQTEVKCALK